MTTKQATEDIRHREAIENLTGFSQEQTEKERIHSKLFLIVESGWKIGFRKMPSRKTGQFFPDTKVLHLNREFLEFPAEVDKDTAAILEKYKEVK